MLTTLPPELVFFIADELGDCRKDVYALAACHRRLYDILLSRLFSDVCFPPYNPRKKKKKNPNFRKFLYAVHQNPKLIDTVRSFSVEGPYTTCLPPTNKSLSNLTFKVIQSSLATFPEEQREEWIVPARAKDPNVWLALLILRLKNLRTIVLHSPPTQIKTCSTFLGLALMQAASTPIWPCLESATLSFLRQEYASTKSEMDLLALFPSIPSIRSLYHALSG